VSASPSELVAVYGTLKQGECNHHLLAESRWLGRVVLRHLHLYDLGPYPMAVVCADPLSTVSAELYAVSAAVLARLDDLEDHPREYERRQFDLQDGRRAWVYVGRQTQVRGYPLLVDGVWRGRS
jgi:gamma-glutamylcyclotransferase (GGCT)/AIG2-like uncharacterized protein YtfP